MQTRMLVVLALILVAIPVVGCAEVISTPNVRITWTPAGDVDGNEFPSNSVVSQVVEYEVQGSGEWTAIPGLDLEYLGTGVQNEARWMLPDRQAYDFRVVLQVDWQGSTFVQICETEALQYFGIAPFACDAGAEE